MLASRVDECVSRERHGRGVKDTTGDADEGDYQDDLQRVNDVVGELRCGYVEAKEKGDEEAEKGGAAEDGVDADEEADGDAPGQFLRGGSHAEKCEDRKHDATVGPVVMYGRRAFDSGEVGFAGVHC
jgi:hypothetical protein